MKTRFILIFVALGFLFLAPEPSHASADLLIQTVTEIGRDCVRMVRVCVLNFMLIYGLYLGVSLGFGQTQAQELTTFLLGAIIAIGAAFVAALFALTLFRP